MDSDREHKTSGSEKKEFITHRIAGNTSISIFELVSFAHMSHGGAQMDMTHAGVCITNEEPGSKGSALFENMANVAICGKPVPYPLAASNFMVVMLLSSWLNYLPM